MCVWLHTGKLILSFFLLPQLVVRNCKLEKNNTNVLRGRLLEGKLVVEKEEE
jgi:hypothetical protein